MANVLLVDDSTPTLNRLARHFRRWGHEVKTESDAGNVIRAMADQSTDLVVLDVLMLDVDGIDVLRAIRRHVDPGLAATPVIMHSMARDPRIIAQALKAGAQDYVIKATSAEELRHRVAKCLIPPSAAPHAPPPKAV